MRTDERRIAVIAGLRRLRMTGAEIAETLAMPASTVSGILTRIGLGKLWRLEPLEPPNRYEKHRPGELVHVDVKKLGRIGRPGHRVNGDRRTRSRGIGWEYVHVAIDDATRLVYVEVLDDDVELRVLDSTADMRYLVIPRRPDGTEDMSEDELAGLITRDSMIGVARAAAG